MHATVEDECLKTKLNLLKLGDNDKKRGYILWETGSVLETADFGERPVEVMRTVNLRKALEKIKTA